MIFRDLPDGNVAELRRMLDRSAERIGELTGSLDLAIIERNAALREVEMLRQANALVCRQNDVLAQEVQVLAGRALLTQVVGDQLRAVGAHVGN